MWAAQKIKKNERTPGTEYPPTHAHRYLAVVHYFLYDNRLRNFPPSLSTNSNTVSSLPVHLHVHKYFIFFQVLCLTDDLCVDNFVRTRNFYLNWRNRNVYQSFNAREKLLNGSIFGPLNFYVYFIYCAEYKQLLLLAIVVVPLNFLFQVRSLDL